MESRGKKFEQELRLSMEAAGLMVHRISNAVSWDGHRMVGAPTPGDFYAFGTDSKGSLTVSLIEAKAVNGNSLPFSRLEKHQLDSLNEFDSLSDDVHGWVAVNFYDAEDIRHHNRCFMIPVSAWNGMMRSGERRSVPISACESDDSTVECPRAAASTYDMREWASRL